jgi:hypothetical protein
VLELIAGKGAMLISPALAARPMRNVELPRNFPGPDAARARFDAGGRMPDTPIRGIDGRKGERLGFLRLFSGPITCVRQTKTGRHQASQ